MIIQILCLDNLTSIPIQAIGSYKASAGKMFIFIIQAQAALKTPEKAWKAQTYVRI